MHDAFAVHKLSDEGLAKMQEVAEKLDNLLAFINENAEPTRTLALTATKLEEACFYAKKSLAAKHARNETRF